MYVPTDESLRSRLEYGKTDFPFSCYLDRLGESDYFCIEWHWHSEFELSFVKEGRVRCRVGTETAELGPGEGVFLNSEIIHRFESDDRAVLVNYVFAPEFLAERNSLIYANLVRPYLTADLEYWVFRSGKWTQAWDEIYDALCEEKLGRELRIRSAVSQLWLILSENTLEALQDAPRSRSKRTQARLHNMMSYIHDHYRRPLSLEEIASASHISKSEALRCFHDGLQTTPVKYLNDFRLSRAAERLQKTGDPVSILAMELGFDSAGYFCKAFKTKYGVSPGQFRKQARGEGIG